MPARIVATAHSLRRKIRFSKEIGRLSIVIQDPFFSRTYPARAEGLGVRRLIMAAGMHYVDVVIYIVCINNI
jgi:hypothetical protein